MGTRHVVTVILDGAVKVAQYGQWDGYPTYTGVKIQEFLRAVNLNVFSDKIAKVSWYTKDEINAAWKDAGADDSGWVSMDVSNRLEKKHPELSRNTGVDVLWLIAQGKVNKLSDQSDFTKDTVWCEYHYVIDLDNQAVAIYSSGNAILASTIEDFINADMNELQEF